MTETEERAEPPIINDLITVGRLVEVASRTWPGINKPGGVARVMEVHFDHDEDTAYCGNNDINTNAASGAVSGRNSRETSHVNVKYILGGSREKRVPVEYVKLAPQYESNEDASQAVVGGTTVSSAKTLRDRSMLLGRCRRCGSLRKDCGSCDWATEEAEAKQGEQRATEAATSKTRNSNWPLTVLEEEDPFSSSDEDDDGAIQRLIRQLSRRHGKVYQSKKNGRKKERRLDKKFSRRRRGIGIRQKSSLVAATTNSRSESTINERLTDDFQKGQQEDSLSSSEDENDQGVDTQPERHSLHERYKRYSRLSGYSGSMISLDFPSSSSSASSEDEALVQMKARRKMRMGAKRKETIGISVLESLTTREKNSSDLSTEVPKIRSRIRQKRPSFTDAGDKRTKEMQDLPVKNDGRTVDSLESSSDSDMTRGEPRKVDAFPTKASSVDQQLLALEARARREVERNLRQDPDGGFAAIDGDFIQPEGEEAAENLPSDVADLSKTILYRELALFFDTMATKMEDDTIPDFKLRIALLQRDLRSLKNPRTASNSGAEDSSISSVFRANKLLGQCDLLWTEVHAILIRNGSDQCRAALRRLMNDRLYRKNKKRLTTPQQRLCRGPGVMDARNLRMDAIEESVEDVVHRLKSIVDQCEEECVVQADASKEDSAESDFSDDNMEFDQGKRYHQHPLASISLADMDRKLNSSNIRSPRLHPHSTATNHGQKPEKLVVRSKSKRPSSRIKIHTVRSRKRTKTDVRLESASDQSMTIQKRSDAVRIASLPDVNAAVTSGLDETVASRDDSMIDGCPASPDDEEGQPNIGTDSKSSTPIVFQDGGKAKPKSRISSLKRHICAPNIVDGTTPARALGDRNQSISERMQAFLDANSGNGSAEFSNDEDVNSVSPKWWRFQRQKRLNTKNPPNSDINALLSEAQPRSRANNCSSSSFLERNYRRDIETWHATEYHQHFSTCSDANEYSADLPDVEVGSADLPSDLPSLFSKGSDHFLVSLQNVKQGLLCRQSSVSILKKLQVLLTSSDGLLTIQQVLRTRRKDFCRHMRFLAVCLYAATIDYDDQDLPWPFGRTCRENFIDLVVLQLLDTLYAVLLPSAWGISDAIDTYEVILDLIPLRDALATRIDLLECTCRCLVQRLPCQQWRRGALGCGPFISSVDPTSWAEFLQSESPPKNPEAIRFKKLGELWPRAEILCLWRILAFIGGTATPIEGSSTFKWQVLSKLFSAGNLTTVQDFTEANNPCSPEYVTDLRGEINYFAQLVGSGNMNFLPKADSMMVNLIQRALILQAETLIADENARIRCFPRMLETKEGKKQADLFLRFTDPTFLESLSIQVRTIPVVDMMGECSKSSAIEKEYRDALKPSSKLLSSCLALLAGWCKNVPRKRVRQGRLAKAIEALQGSLLNHAQRMKTMSNPASHTSMSFEDAFSEKKSVEIGSGPARAAAFLTEASAMIDIVGRACESPMAISDKEFACAIWNSIANPTLVARQALLSTDSGQLAGQPARFEDDLYSLIANTKIMASLLFLQMNASPWHPSLGKSIVRIFQSTEREEGQTLCFGLSCIFACLDCLIDTKLDLSTCSHMYKIIVLIFQTMTTKIRSGEKSTCFDSVKSKCLPHFGSVLVKCAKAHLSAQASSHDVVHFRYFYSVIRAIQYFVATTITTAKQSCVNEDNIVTTGEPDEDEAVWGGIDDSDLANFDMDSLILGATDKSKPIDVVQLYKFLSGVAEVSKPSCRFTIVDSSHTTTGENFVPSPFGKCLVSNELFNMCDSLSLALATAPVDSQIAPLLLRWIYPPIEDSEDSNYYNKASRRLSSRLCLLAKQHSKCHDFVVDQADALVFSFLASLLDSKRLESFPSCNLDKIREMTGESGLEQALALLDLLNDDTLAERSESSKLQQLQRRRKQRASEVWRFCSDLGSALVRVKDGTREPRLLFLGNALVNTEERLPPDFNCHLHLISLEKEAFNIFCLLKRMFSNATKYRQADGILIERMASWALLCLANQTLGIVRSLRYHEQSGSASSQDFDQSTERTKLSNLLSCYVEVLVCFVVWITREKRHGGSDCWNNLMRILRERLLSPVLRYQQGDTTIILQELIASSHAVLGRHHYRESSTMGILGCAKYTGTILFESILRRSKQLLIASALNKDASSLPNAVLEAVLNCQVDEEENVIWKVGTSFPFPFQNSTNQRVWKFESPLHKEIDAYFDAIENTPDATMDMDCRSSIHEMKRNFLEHYMLPRLCHKRLDCDKKRRLIKLLNYLLECHAKTTPASSRTSHTEDRTLLDFESICTLIKGLTLTMHHCLMQKTVDEGLFNSTILCAVNLGYASIPIDGCRECLLEWSGRKIVTISGKNMLDLCKAEVDAAYAWIFFKWMDSIALIVASNNDETLNEIVELRGTCRKFASYHGRGLIEEPIDFSVSTNRVEQWQAMLGDFERFLFPPNLENVTSTINVYAKAATRQIDWKAGFSLEGNAPVLETWSPTPASRRSAKEFIAAIVSMS